MSIKQNALPAAATTDRAENQKPRKGSGSSDILPQNEDNFTDKTAERIFRVLGRLYGEEQGLDVEVVVEKVI